MKNIKNKRNYDEDRCNSIVSIIDKLMIKIENDPVMESLKFNKILNEFYIARIFELIKVNQFI